MFNMYSNIKSVMSWNVRGLCSVSRQEYVRNTVRAEMLDVAMLQETKTGSDLLQVKGYVCIPSISDRGSAGCMMLIKNVYKIREVTQSAGGRWIAAQICIGEEWIGLINVYAPNSPQERKTTWGQLSALNWDVPLLLGGDWNCDESELSSPEWKDWIKTWDAVDVSSMRGCSDLSFPTWTNRHVHSNFIAKRLDRFYLSDKGMWVNHKLQGSILLHHTVSDHSPIKFQFRCKIGRRVGRGPPAFKFNTSFLKDKVFCKDMQATWTSAIQGIQHPESRWEAGVKAIVELAKLKGKSQAKNRRKWSLDLDHALKSTRLAASEAPNDTIILHLLQGLEDAARRAEIQKAESARVQANLYWLTVGDAPNKTFFRALRAKKDNELITAVRRADGSVTESEEEIKSMFRESLSSIVGMPMVWNDQLKQKLQDFLRPVDNQITDEKRTLLGRPFSVLEVENVVSSMKRDKTPGPDGIQAEVLQELVKYAAQDLCDLLNHWRREGTIQKEFNLGLIKLIPKAQDRMEVKNFRPLTMLNTVYKVMAKALALRIRFVVNQVVHPKQYGFVHGRSIHEAILNLITAIDWASEQEDDFVMINMDLEKAYDRVSWEFILAVIDKMGFGPLFSGMVKTLFQNAAATIQVNGYNTEEFQLSRSIRQGCPLAPLLFALATDPLLRNLDMQLQSQAIKPLPLPQDQVFLAQLFADDNCNIIRCEQESISRLMQTYQEFCDVSGSKIAPQKTECLRLTFREDNGVLREFGLSDAGVGTIIRYLGCPVGLGLTQKQCFTWIKSRIEAKVQARGHLQISLAGRIIALRHILMALPVYLATILSFSDSSWSTLEKCFREFLWKYADKKAWHCISWSQVCTPVDEGGWGIPNIIHKAQELLLKWIAKLECNQPWAVIIREKIRGASLHGYVWPNSPWIDKIFCPLQLKVCNSPSIQHMVTSWKKKVQGATWSEDQRFDSSLKQSIWLCSAAMTSNQPAVLLNPRTAKNLEKKGISTFQDIWDQKNLCWGMEPRRWAQLKASEKIHISQVIQAIKRSWPTSPLASTEPSINSWDLKTCKPPNQGSPWIEKMSRGWAREGCAISEKFCRRKARQVWKQTISRRQNLLLWRIMARKLPVRAISSKWGKSTPMCPRCQTCRETTKHAFWDCKGVLPLWKYCSKTLESFGVTDRIGWKQAVLGDKGKMNPAIYMIWQYIRASILSKIWYDRNLLAHGKPALCLDDVQIRKAITEGCLLARNKAKLRSYASILLRKLKRLSPH